MRDIMCSGYVAGSNTAFFGSGSNEGGAGPFDPEDVRDEMASRLSFDDDAAGEYKSMLAFCAPYGDGAKRDQVISISPRLLPWEVNRSDGGKPYFPGGENGNFDKVKGVLGLDSIHHGEDMRAAENMEFISNGSLNNALCFVGPHRKYNPFSNQYHELIPGQGHFGPGEHIHSARASALKFQKSCTQRLLSVVRRCHPRRRELLHSSFARFCTPSHGTAHSSRCAHRAALTRTLPICSQARWRRGEAVSLKAARDSMVSLEAAAHAQMYMTKKP